MSMLDEYKQIQQQKSTGSSQQSSSGAQRKSILQEYVESKGTEGLNKKYVESALKNGGGFGAIPGGIYQNEDGSRYIKPYTAANAQESLWKNKYKGKSYLELQKIIGGIEPDSEEYNWLNSHKYELYNGAVDFESNAAAGLQAYEAYKTSQRQDEEDKPWYQWIAETLGNTSDTTLPGANITTVIDAYREDTSYMEPGQDWTEEQKKTFGYLYSIDKGEASAYAKSVNEAANQAAQQEQTAKVEEWAKENKVAGTAAAIATMPLSLVDTMDALAQYNARGFISTNSNMLPGQFSSTITGAISKTLNEKSGTIDEDIPIIGGKGMGDVYQLGTSIANSMITGYTQGVLGTYMVFFGSASANGINEAKNRGATDSQAITYGIMMGLAEAAGEAFSIDKLLGQGASATTKSFFKNVLQQAGVEASEEGVTTLLNNFTDQLVMQDMSNFNVLVNYYMQEAGLDKETAEKEAWLDMAEDLAFDMLGGFVSGGVSSSIQTGIQNIIANKEAKQIYGTSTAELVEEALELDPSNKLAQKLQSKVNQGKQASGSQLRRLVEQNESAMLAQDRASIQEAATARLTELGETGNVSTIATALAKQAAGEKLSKAEQQAVSQSKYGSRVANELSPEKVRSGEYASSWAESIGTERINVDEYNRIIEEAQVEAVTEESAVTEAQQEAPVAVAKMETTTQETAESVQTASEEQSLSQPAADSSLYTREPGAVSIEEASKKYGAQAGAMLHTYEAGQDVAQYDAAYQRAYEMGNSGVSLDYAKKSSGTAYLSETQIELAYEAGKAAADTQAQERDTEIKRSANGKTGRKKGVVRGEGVTGEDLQKAFGMNATQGRAYNVLTKIAEVTGIDIVLYKSEAGEDGNLYAPEHDNAYGEYRRREPGVLYIDINAGLTNIRGADQLSKYTMLRTFSHEFVHFIENWNPVQYNELRRFVFDSIAERGKNAEDFILTKMNEEGLDYEAASREVVADALTDILPEANFIQELAEKHKTIFDKLLEKLKEFVADIKEYFSGIEANDAPEAKALKDALGYAESIVKLFDQAAVQAVENYQATVATETVVETKAETKVETIVEETAAKVESSEPKTTTRENGYTITDNLEKNSIEIKFDKKPAQAVIDTLKANKFRWYGKKGIWYGRATHEAIMEALDKAYEAEATSKENLQVEQPGDFETAFKNATQEERDEVIEALGHNMSAAMPTEIIEEEKTDGENADNNGTVREPDSDRPGDPQILEGSQDGDVQGDAPGGDSLGDLEERGRETVRTDVRSDTAGTEGVRSEGDSESSDIRRADGLSQEETAAKVEALQETVTEQIEQQSTEEPKGSNFVIDESLNLPSGAKTRFRANVDAIRLIKQLNTEGRYATKAEQEILSKYVGWGGLSEAFGELTYNREKRKSEMTPKTGWEKEFNELRQLVTDGVITEEEYQAASKSTQNAHYTSVEVIKAMYDGLSQLGFKGGRMLEPSSGVGNFVGGMPASMSSQVNSWTMVELDRITGQIAKYLYPQSDVRIQGFEKAQLPDNYMDVAIGNVPFGNYGVVDKNYPKRITSSIHNYFFIKSLDKVRPGGVVMFITSSFTMNGRDSSIRQDIMKRADLLGAIRLPNTAFAGNAGTQVVTDILILKKRAPGTEYSGEAFLDSPYTNVSGNQGDYINEYFSNHPEMVLGTPAFARGMYGANSLTYNPLTDKGSLGEQIREAFTHIEGRMDYKTKASPEKANFAVERATKKTKNGGLVVNSDGSISRNENGTVVPVKADAKTAKRIAGLLSIRDSYRQLANYLQQGQDAKYIKQARKALNEAYDSFVKEHGFINAQVNRKAIADDPDCFAIFALENYDAETKKGTKADIFTKDTISPNKTINHVEDIQSGVIVSVNQTGGVDTALIAKLTGKTEDAVTRELIDSRMAFKTRDGSLETPEKYLSGNVRAKLRDAENLAPFDKDYENNVEELRKVIPVDIPYHDIYVTPGAPWVPTNVYADFIAEMLGGYNSETSYRGPDIVVGKSNQGDFKIVVNNTRLKGNYLNTQKWGTKRRSFLDLIDAMMASRSITVNDTIEDPLTGKKKSVINKVETAAAQEKVEEITKEFQDWLWRDENRRNELASLYNEVFNALVTPKYDGSNLTVNGQNPQFNLRPHQADAVQRIIASGGNTLLAHKVGAGKTLEMAAAAMKLRELGLVKKPMFVVPKSLVAQWGVEFMNYYPAAKLLVADEKSFTKANRMTYANRIANGDYDAVILSYEQFEKIPMSADFQQQFYQEQINEILDAIAEEKAETKGKGITVKEMEKKKAQLEKKIAELTTKAKDEDNIDFEHLGVDSIFVDEAHNFKNLQYVSRMNNISGLSNKDGSQRAFDLYTKVRYLQKLNGGKGIVFATATPVMNSMAEMYIMQKYLQSDVLEQLGLKSFDAWAKQFGEVVNSVEIKPSGQGFRVKQTFSNFRNLNELQLLFRSFSDVLTKVPGLKIPKMKGGGVKVVVCEPGQFQKDYMAELEKRADNVKNVDPSEDNMLKITSDGRKVSYTQRMIDPTLPYEPGCKIYRCCENVLTEYKDSKKIKGTQIIFCDMATPKGKSKTANATENEDETEFDVESAKLYDDMRAYLIKKGIPAKEIAFIHEADTDAKKKKLFADVNEGKVRVLIGSTGKMGVGMNAQKRIVAIHHLDAPWRPGDVEQRDGRAFRQGNINEEVTKYTYVTEGSFDARLWDILDRKQHFINQIMNGEDVGRSAEDTGDVTLSAAEVKALASGNPLIEEHVKLTTELQKLENLQQAYKSNITRAKAKLADAEKNIATLNVRTANLKEDIKARKDTYSDGKFSITIGKHKFTDKKEAGVALIAEIKAKASEDGYTTVGSFAGFELRVIKQGHEYSGLLFGKQGYSFNVYVGNTTYGINHLISVAEGLDGRLETNQERLKELTADREAQKQILAEPFNKQAELEQKRSRFNEIMDILNPKEEQAIADDTVQHQARKYSKPTTPYKKINGQEYRQIQEDRITKYGDMFDEMPDIDYIYAHNMLYVIENFDETQFGVIQRVNPATNKALADRILEALKNGTVRDIQDYRGRLERIRSERKLRSVYNAPSRNGGAAGSNAGVDNGGSSGRRTDPNGAGVLEGSGNDNEGNTQYQQRRETLTDRDILAMAAREIKIDDLSAGEQDALRIFRDRLNKLETLQIERAEQGRLYREQQFGTKVDREAAKATLNRMHVLDEQISRASAEVLSVEDKQVLKRVLQKARTVVEQQKDQQWNERLSRYRDRRDNAAAIKKYRERLRGDVDELSNWIVHPNNKNVVKHVPDALKDSVIPFLSSINFMSKRSLAGGDPTIADKAFLKRLDSLKNALKQNIDVNGMYSGYNDLPPDFMENMQRFIDTARTVMENNQGEFIINQMTAEELKELSKLVRTLKKYIMQVNRFHANAMFQHVFEAGDNSIEFMSELGNAGNTGTVSNFLLWQQMRPAYAFERFGKGGMAIYDGLRRGQATLAFNTKKITEFAEKAYTAAEVKAWENEIKTIRLGPGKTVTMRVSQIMSLYELNKRDQAKGHILGEGIRVATFKDGKTKISDVGQTLTPGELNLILKELTPRQKEVADQLQQFMAKQGGEWGNHVSVARWGEELFGEEHYFPINSDGRHLQATADEHPSAASLYALLNMSFTKELQEGANNRIILYSIFDVFANHMASMAQYNAFALPVLDSLKWFNYQQTEDDGNGGKIKLGSVREQMARKYGVPEESRPGSGRQGYAESFVINIIKAFNGTEAQGVPADETGMNALRQYNMAQVAFNFRVMVQQPLAITRAALLVDYSSIIKGMRLKPADIKANIEEMQKYSGIAAWKSLGFYDINISRGLTDLIKHDTDWRDKVSDIGMKGAEVMDTLTWAGIWSACKEQVIKKQGIKPGAEGFYEAVTQLFEDVVYKTQVVDSVLTKNEYLRSKGFFTRAMASFMSEPTTTASMLIDAYNKYAMDMQRGMSKQQAWQKNRGMIVRVAYVYGIGAVALAAAQAVADAFRDDDDYQSFLEKWLEAFGGNLIDEFMPFNKLPIVSDFYDLVKELLSIVGVDTYGNPPQTVFMQWYDSLINGTQILYDKISGEDSNYTWYGGVYKLFQAVSGITGLPMAAATREIVTAWNNTVGAMAPSLKVKTYEPSETAQIRYAYEDGWLTEEEAVQELLSQGLVDNENEAYWTMRGWEAGDGYSRYDAVYDAVRNGGSITQAMDELTSHGYTEKEIVSKIEGQIGTWYREGEISKQQAISMLTRYGDMDSEDITKAVNKWSAVVVTGIAYEDIKDAYFDGEITARRAAEMYVKYGGYTQEDADLKVQVYEWQKEVPGADDITSSAIKDYNEIAGPAGISKEVYYKAWSDYNDTPADYDEAGDSIPYSKTIKVMPIINNLPLTAQQKTALALCWWAEGTVKKYKLW